MTDVPSTPATDRTVSHLPESLLSILGARRIRRAGNAPQAPKPEGRAPVLESPMSLLPRRAEAASETRTWSRVIPLQGGASIFIQSLTQRLFVVGVHDHLPEQVLLNREELQLLRAAIDVALEVSE